ncbi:FadR/GntR family transcriptional regulator [Neisseria leonii]|uniref:Pyruvate dehydrogenase complex repressor n=1 Tax=Neisseria leonii TaxID=2995413 RepID=A0A9X4IAI4_9NEIS|nr:FadR/GntR family transcriptional regulator [Neisseria sp. 51.81]MDD9327399.1 FadR family transcriptional regulator [Neisseria sp. 51.81]
MMPYSVADTVRQQPLSMQLAAVLEERILQNVYPIHSKLPPERRLAEEFGVSRQSLRSALNILSTRGMLHARQGDGHYVSDYTQGSFRYGWEDLIDGREGMESEVLDFRRGIEGMLAALAARRRTDADLLRMRLWLDRLHTARHTHDLDLRSTADVAFHQAIAEAAHNLLFTRLSDGLLRLLTKQTKTNLANMFDVPDVEAELLAQHEAIYRAIEAQDETAAMQAAYRHLDYVQAALDSRHRQMARETVSCALAEGDKRR